jgi:regulator of protease activity HflC (stomatin/prohibitin superfamily)
MSDDETSKKGWTYVDRHGDTHINVPKLIKTVAIVVGAALILLIFWPAVSIGPTYRGVPVTFGEPNVNNILQPGLHFKVPIVQTIKTYDLTPRKTSINIEIKGGKAAVSKDKQEIGANGEAIWKYDDTKIGVLITTYESESKLNNDVDNAIYTAVVNTIGKYNIDQIAVDQDKIASEARGSAAQKLQDANIPAVITMLNLSNWDWPDDYNEMIKRTQNMAQQAQMATQELAMVEQTAQKQIKEANAKADADAAAAEGRKRAAIADADAARERANGERDARIASGEGERRYYAEIEKTLDTAQRMRELDIELKRAERWDGREVPNYLPLSPNGGVVTLPAK